MNNSVLFITRLLKLKVLENVHSVKDNKRKAIVDPWVCNRYKLFNGNNKEKSLLFQFEGLPSKRQIMSIIHFSHRINSRSRAAKMQLLYTLLPSMASISRFGILFAIFSHRSLVLTSMTRSTTWTPVELSYAWFEEEARIMERILTPNGTNKESFAVKECNERYWCRLVCVENQTTTLILSDIFVKAMYIEVEDEPFYPCWTNRPRTNYLNHYGSVSIHSSTPSAFPNTEPENLLEKGIYTFVLADERGDHCFFSKYPVSYPNAFVMFDLGSLKLVSTVLLVASNMDNHNFFKEIDIRVGAYNLTDPADFSSYALLGTHTGSANKLKYTYETNSVRPIKGRYVLIQCVNCSNNVFGLCYIEIY